MRDIFENFPITNEEYRELSDEFEKLCYYASHGLKKKNSKNNVVEDIDDISQELKLSIIRAGSYYKRQIYIERSFVLVRKHVKDVFMSYMLDSLENLWHNRTRHGANRQKYGPPQERLLDRMVEKIVPRNEWPDKTTLLKIDTKFARYCKAIIWNSEKSMGKKITKEKSIRSGLASISEFSI